MRNEGTDASEETYERRVFTKRDTVIDNIIVYISGFVVRKVRRSLSCPVCKGQLITVEKYLSAKYLLLALKDEGGLVYPSNDVIKVVTAAEKAIRATSDIRRLSESTMSFNDILHSVFDQTRGQRLFDEHRYDAETRVGIDPHQGRADVVGALSLGWNGAHILCVARQDARGGGS